MPAVALFVVVYFARQKSEEMDEEPWAYCSALLAMVGGFVIGLQI